MKDMLSILLRGCDVRELRLVYIGGLYATALHPVAADSTKVRYRVPTFLIGSLNGLASDERHEGCINFLINRKTSRLPWNNLFSRTRE
jgi:hypothetical protein